MAPDTPRIIFTAITVALYLGSFFLPAWRHSHAYEFLGAMFGGQPISGARTFIVALVFVVGLPMWLANPFYWLGLRFLALGKQRAALRAAFVALLLALSELPFIFTEALVGYYVWIGSISVLLTASVYCFPSIESARSCKVCLAIVQVSVLALCLIVGWLLLHWQASFGRETLQW